MTRMDFDALRAAVVPGDGVVGRWPGLVCVADCADRAVLRRLLDVFAECRKRYGMESLSMAEAAEIVVV